jgi:DNA polymerase-3 subunit chi
MPEIGFYHLTRTDVAAALPPLLARTLAAGERALVLCGAPARVAALDEALWLAQNPDWLPHGTGATPHPEWQPVFLTPVEVNPAGARFLFLTDGAETANPAGYTRIFDLFDGNDEAEVAAARRRWKAAKDAAFPVTYWRQGANGWEKAA